MSSGAKKPCRPVKALRERRKRRERFLVEFGLEEGFCVGSVWGEDHALLSTVSTSFLLLLVRHLLLEAMHLFLVASLLLVVRPGAPSSVLVPSRNALCS